MKIYIALFILFTIPIFAQNTPKNDPEDFPHLYFGAGVIFDSDYAINSQLKLNELPPIATASANFMTGITFFNKDVDLDLGYDFTFNANSNGDNKNRTSSSGLKIRALYVLLYKPNFAINTGLSFSYTEKKLTVFNSNQEVDFNNLPAENYGNQLTLNLTQMYLGPTISARFKNYGRFKTTYTKLILGYEFGVSSKKWTSKTFDLQNDIREKGNNRIILQLIFTL